MAEGDRCKWVGVRPTDPAEDIPVALAAGSEIEVVQDTAADLKVEAVIAANQQIEVVQDVPADLVATVTQAAKDRYNELQAGAAQVGISVISKSGVSTIHTVTDNKTLYITSVHLSCYNYDATESYGYLTVTTAGLVFQYALIYLYVNSDDRSEISLNFNPPKEASAGWLVRAGIATGYMLLSASIHGYEK